MRVVLKVTLDVTALEKGVLFGETDAYVAATEGVREALEHAENRGFNHEHSDWVGINLVDITCEAIDTTAECKLCGESVEILKAHVHQREWVCKDCWDERLDERLRASE